MVSKEYLEHLWFILHHSDDTEGITMAVTCYLDESGTDLNSDNPVVVVAGLVMTRDNFLMLDIVWNDILSQFKIEPPIHMKEFGKHGRLGHIDYPIRFQLFTQLIGLINCYKTHSVAAIINYNQFKNIVNNKVKCHIGPYGICFMLCANLCFGQANEAHYRGAISFILEQGAKHSGHILKAHETMMQIQKDKVLSINVGSIAFEPKKLSILQAADIIAWGVRRSVSGIPIGKGFQPISNLYNIKHLQWSYSDDELQEFSNVIMGH
jgi:hypothetical protein